MKKKFHGSIPLLFSEYFVKLAQLSLSFILFLFFSNFIIDK